MNATNLVLIPKITNASKTSDFRPISCLNTSYKVISKLLAERLKGILNAAIGHSQSAFLPGRLLSENVLLATEIVHGYNTANVDPSGMLKVDLRKAFDTLRWDFVIAALRGINIPELFIDWIYECISTASFSISVNGHTGGYFNSTQGLRQGDPLSPYLFVLAMEVFSGLLRSRYNSGYIKYHPKTEDLGISHLMFADDVMVFFDGGSSSLHGITETLDDFAGWSGLNMNREKTELFHAGLSAEEAVQLTAYGFPLGTFPIRYLGLPLTHRKLRISEYSPLLDKLNRRFNHWATKSLSFAGRCLLIKTVISGTVIFWTSTFLLPKGCISRIESLCSRFLWSGSTDRRANAKVAWSIVCLPKQEGGLGLRSFRRWNLTLLLRFAWLLFSGSCSLWVAWHRYHNCPTSYSFWSQSENQSMSWNWRCLLRLRDLTSRFLVSDVNDGYTTSFWFDNWTPLGPLINVFGGDGTRRLQICLEASVADACNEHGWRLPHPRSEHEVTLHIFLTNFPLPTIDRGPDMFGWSTEGDVNRTFSSAKTWEVLRHHAPHQPFSKHIWFSGATPKHAFHMWVTNLNRLPTRSRLAAWGMQIPSVCCICSSQPETRDHLMLSCPFAEALWSESRRRFRDAVPVFTDWNELVLWLSSSSPETPSHLRMLVVQALFYNIWKQRNNMLHNQALTPPLATFREIDRHTINSINAWRKRKRFMNLMACWLI